MSLTCDALLGCDRGWLVMLQGQGRARHFVLLT